MRGLLASAAVVAGVVGSVRVAAFVRHRREAIAAVAPELRSPGLYLPLHLSSRAMARTIRRLPTPSYDFPASIRHEVRSVAGNDGRPGVQVHVYQRVGRKQPSGVLYWIHGGGFVIGTPAMGHDFCVEVAEELDVLVVSVDYRLAPEHPFPEGLEDCYTGLRWVADRADELGIDPNRIAVGGNSAGGGLAACLAQLAHDRGEVELCFQLLVYPMLDDRTTLRADHRGTGEFVWTPKSNLFGWTSYLGRRPELGSAPEYAAAARRVDLAGLPPAWIGVGDLDLFHAEDVEYATRLTAAGVPTDLLVVPGMYHGADGLGRLAETASMLAFNAAKLDALRVALGRSTSGRE